MRPFITGVSGYPGSVVMEHLEDDPKIEKIVGVDLRPPSRSYPNSNSTPWT
ncbi:MAG: hypothetical protein SWK76_07785 [Actinomycetota bacterium]|nr:hypothetical protein [Actinomycetota bacterium]